MKAPVSLCLIARNEGSRIFKHLSTVRDYVEHIVVVDTGSDDNTVEEAKKIADVVEVYTKCNNPDTGLMEDFSGARNYSFSLATQPWVMWMDADDYIVGAEHLNEVIQEFSHPLNTHAVFVLMPYEYSHDENGKCTLRHYRERLACPVNGFKWVNPVHEVLVPNQPNTYQYKSDKITFIHDRKDKPITEPGRNLRILESYYKKVGDSDARQLYYLGLEYSNMGQIDNSIKFLEKYVSLSGWDDEKCLALIKLCEMHINMMEYEKVIDYAHRAHRTREHWAEPYFFLAKAHYFLANKGTDPQKNWKLCAQYGKFGLSLPPTDTILFINPVDRQVEIHRYLNVALANIGEEAGALQSVEEALKTAPNDSQLSHNKAYYQKILIKKQLENDLSMYRSVGACTDESVNIIKGMLEGLPAPQKDIFPAYFKSPNYPLGINQGQFPKAITSPHAQAWALPTVFEIDDLPLTLEDEQLQATVLMIWKQYMLHDEILSAIGFLQNAPYRVRHTAATQRALNITRNMIAWIDDSTLIQKHNSPANTEVEGGKPMPYPLEGQEANRFNQIVKHLPNKSVSIVDFGCFDGCFTNRYGLLGHKVIGLDLSETSVKLANKKAKQFNTGTKHIVTMFHECANKLPHKSFDYATSTDTYEHLKDPVSEMLVPAKKLLKPNGKFLLVTPYGAWLRGQYLEWAHPWIYANEGKGSWLAENPRGHLVAPTSWTVAEDFRKAGYWVKNSHAVLCKDVNAYVSENDLDRQVIDQGNVFAEAYVKAPSKYPGLDVVFYIGDGLEAWTPETVKRDGIGGSELMAIELTKRLAALGHKVRVYSGSGKNGEGIYDGVEYHHSNKFANVKCDVLVVSRTANLLSPDYNTQVKIKLLWCHDVIAVNGYNKFLLQANKILSLSNWHKDNLVKAHNLHPDHIRVTRNGIDTKRFKKIIPRNRFKVINSSSPDRSWPILLECWPAIKKQVPQAELHLFYGFRNWEILANAKKDPGELATIQRLKDMISSLQSQDVHFRDRLPQDKLAEEFLSAGVLAYPTWFSETSCITAMEAQAAGLRIVTSSLAALNETVADRGIRIIGEWTSDSYKNAFINECVAALQNEDDSDRKSLQKYAEENFSLDKLAKEWDEAFYELIDEAEKSPMPPYQPTETYR